MRETCARVLAAALMTGAIASVVAMSALFDTPREAAQAPIAPPSSLERSVRVTVRPTPRHPPVARRRVVTHMQPAPAPEPVIVGHEIVRRTVVRPRRRHQARALASVKPAPAPVVAPAVAVAVPAVEAPPPAPEERDDDGNSPGKGGEDHGHGDHGHGHEEHED
jgi:hypothetical protein